MELFDVGIPNYKYCMFKIHNHHICGCLTFFIM